MDASDAAPSPDALTGASVGAVAAECPDERIRRFLSTAENTAPLDGDSLTRNSTDSADASSIPTFDELDDAEARDGLEPMPSLGLTDEMMSAIRDSKRSNPEMFVSAWEEDSTGVDEKNMDDKGEQFLTAAEEGRTADVLAMIDADPAIIKACDKDGYTALHRAAYNDHADTVRQLLARGADAEAVTADGWTALHSACNWANADVIGALLSHGVRVNRKSNGNLTPLHVAISSQEDPDRVFHSVRYLLQAPGIDVGSLTGAGDTALELARRSSPACYQLMQDFHAKV